MKRAILVSVVLAVVGLAGPVDRIDARESPSKLRRMLLTLDDTLVTFDFKEKPLAEVLKFFTDFTGVNLVLAPAVQAEAGNLDLDVTLRLTKISVRSALEIILELKNLGSVYRHGVIMITTPEDARGKPKLRIYSIGDLTVRIRDFPGPDMMLKPSGAEDFGRIFGGEEEGREHAFADPDFIQDLVTDNTGPDTWDDDGVRISVNRRLLIVRQYPSVHREIARLLALLRGYR